MQSSSITMPLKMYGKYILPVASSPLILNKYVVLFPSAIFVVAIRNPPLKDPPVKTSFQLLLFTRRELLTTLFLFHDDTSPVSCGFNVCECQSYLIAMPAVA